MLLIREVFYCKPGKVRALKDKFVAMSKLGEKMGMPKMRLLTDFAGEQYWTLVAEMEVANLRAFEEMFESMGKDDAASKQFAEIMKDYHDLIVKGRREIYTIEG